MEMTSRAAGLDEDAIAKAILMNRLMVDAVFSEPIYQSSTNTSCTLWEKKPGKREGVEAIRITYLLSYSMFDSLMLPEATSCMLSGSAYLVRESM